MRLTLNLPDSTVVSVEVFNLLADRRVYFQTATTMRTKGQPGFDVDNLEPFWPRHMPAAHYSERAEEGVCDFGCLALKVRAAYFQAAQVDGGDFIVESDRRGTFGWRGERAS